MTIGELANELRNRQVARGYCPRDVVNNVSDEQMIDSYIRCSHCGEVHIEEPFLSETIKIATSAGDWLELVFPHCEGG